MTESFARTFLALGPPVILLTGTGITVILSVRTAGVARWWALALGPVASLTAAVMATWLVITLMAPGEGSGFLLGAAALGLYSLGIIPYYLGLLAVGIWKRTRGAKKAPHARGSSGAGSAWKRSE